MSKPELLDRILQLRITVGRHGEMDRAKWWNTNGIMGSKGEVVLERGFPRTHALVQARVAFEVARARCASVFAVPDAVTLWNLPAELEDQFESRWSHWLSHSERWGDFLKRADEATTEELVEGLTSLGLVESEHAEQASNAEVQREGRSVSMPSIGEVDGDAVAMLAAGFAVGDTNDLVVPFATLNA